ncbi:hypothetical protein GCM10009848_24410 [Micromonospora lupini]
MRSGLGDPTHDAEQPCGRLEDLAKADPRGPDLRQLDRHEFADMGASRCDGYPGIGELVSITTRASGPTVTDHTDWVRCPIPGAARV